MDYITEYKLKKIATTIPKTKITCSEDAATFARNFYDDDLEVYESFFVMFLNMQNIVESYVKISQGGTSSTIVETKLVAKYAIDSLARSVILIHNHPSGALKATDTDKAMTAKIKKGLNLFDIQVLDHLILTADSYVSFSVEGLI